MKTLLKYLGFSLIAGVLGCTSDDVHATSPFDDLLLDDGSGDNPGGFPVASIQVGTSLSDAVAGKPRGAEVTPDNMKVYQFSVEPGQTVALVVRSPDGLDLFLLIKDRDNREVHSSDSQAVLPMASEDDVVAVHTNEGVAPERLIAFVAGGSDCQHAGSFDLDLLALSESPGVDLGTTHAGLRGVAADLRRVESERAADMTALMDEGALVEGATGYLELGDTGSRISARRQMIAINPHRRDLFDLFVRLSLDSWDRPDYVVGAEDCADLDDDDDDDLVDCLDPDCDGSPLCLMGRVCAELWAPFR